MDTYLCKDIILAIAITTVIVVGVLIDLLDCSNMKDCLVRLKRNLK